MSLANSHKSVRRQFVHFLRLIYGSGSVRKTIANSYKVSESTAREWLSGRIPISDRGNFILWAARVREDLRRHKREIEEGEKWLTELLDNPPGWITNGRSDTYGSPARGCSTSSASGAADVGCLQGAN